MKEISLNGNWRFTFFAPGEGERKKVYRENYPLDEWFKGKVPGTVQGDLLRLGKTPTPFFGEGANKYRFIEKKEWWYARDFSLSPSLKGRRIYLRFEGLDTIATVYLNGTTVGRTQNMFTPYEFELSDVLQMENRLVVRFDPPILVAKKRDKRGIIEYANRSGRDDWHTAAYIRKANFAYGQDMSQRMITVGIWRPVRLIACGEARIKNVQVITKLREKKAIIHLGIEIEKLVSTSLSLDLNFNIRGKKQVIEKTKSFCLSPGKKGETLELSLSLPNPQLWSPNGMGEQNLYSLRVELLRGRNVLDTCEERFGIREVKLLQESDRKEGGKTFGFSINGVKVFAKGANWAPADCLIYPVPARRYRSLLKMAKQANFNMLRINGLGIYEDEEFYRACDEYGIMIWQDFMLSDCPYPDDDKEFVKECKREGEIIVKRLRNHPCVVLWCGNNEVDEIYYGGGHRDAKFWGVWGEKIFHKTLPEVCKRLDPSRPYWPSSAWSSPGNFPLSTREGDVHFYPWSTHKWKTPKGKYANSISLPLNLQSLSYRRYAEAKGKFYSEFGQRAIPCLPTVKKMMAKEDMWPPDEDAWSYHSTRCHWGKDAFERMDLLISEFRNPKEIKDIKEYIFYSQLAQARHLQFGIEEFRRRKFSCSGALFWSFNDCWPCNTYSIVDYYLRRKIAYYWIKKAFDPVLVSFRENRNNLEVWVINGRPRELRGRYTLAGQTFSGKRLWKEEEKIRISPNSSLKLKVIKLNRLKVDDKRKEFVRAVLKVDGQPREAHFFFLPPAALSLPGCHLSTRIKKVKDGYRLFISTDNYARLIQIEPDEKLNPGDNFFDLPAGKTREITLRPLGRIKARDVKIRAINCK